MVHVSAWTGEKGKKTAAPTFILVILSAQNHAYMNFSKMINFLVKKKKNLYTLKVKLATQNFMYTSRLMPCMIIPNLVSINPTFFEIFAIIWQKS